MALCTTAVLKMLEGLIGGLMGGGATLWAAQRRAERKEEGE